MQWLLDPTLWVGLLTLIVLEIALSACRAGRAGQAGEEGHYACATHLVESLPVQARERVRSMGLLLALTLRLGLLLVVFWLIDFTTPLGFLGRLNLSLSDLTLIVGGFYLLFRATLMIYEHTETERDSHRGLRLSDRPGMVVLQIALLNVAFSIAMTTIAVALVDHLPVAVIAAVIAFAILFVAHKSLTRWVSAYPTVTMLCLGFLLILGFALMSQGFGFGVPKGLLLLTIGFATTVAWIVHWAYPKAFVAQSRLPIRERTVQAVSRLLGKNRDQGLAPGPDTSTDLVVDDSFEIQERNMVSGVLTLAERSVHSLMTPRTEISWVNLDDDPEHIKAQLEQEPHSYFPVCRGSLDEVVGIGRAKRMVADILTHGHIRQKRLREPIIIHDTISISRLLETLKRSKGQLVLVADEFGTLQGLITPIDIFEAIAGEFPDEDETPDIVPDGDNRWRMDGATDLHHLEQLLETTGLVDEDDEFTTLAGYLLNRFGQLPKLGDICAHESPDAIYTFEVARIDGRRIALVNVAKQVLPDDQGQGDRH